MVDGFEAHRGIASSGSPERGRSIPDKTTIMPRSGTSLSLPFVPGSQHNGIMEPLCRRIPDAAVTGKGEDESGKIPSGAFFRFQDNSFRQGIRSRESCSGCDRNQKMTTEMPLREDRTFPFPWQDRKLQGRAGKAARKPGRKPGKGRLDPFPVVEVPWLRRSPASCPGTSSPGTSFPDPSCPGPSCPWAWGAVEEKMHGRVVRE